MAPRAWFWVLADTLLHGEGGEEGGDFRSAEVAGMAEALRRPAEPDVLLDPGEIGLLGAEGVVEEAQLVAALVEPLHGTPPRH